MTMTDSDYAKHAEAEAARKAAAPPPEAYTIGERIDAGQVIGVRCLYPVYENGILLAFLGVQTGWGQSWRLWPLEICNDVQRWTFKGFRPDLRTSSSYTVHTYGMKTMKERVRGVWDRLHGTIPYRNQYKTADEVRAETHAKAVERLRVHNRYLEALRESQVTVTARKEALERIAGFLADAPHLAPDLEALRVVIADLAIDLQKRAEVISRAEKQGAV